MKQKILLLGISGRMGKMIYDRLIVEKGLECCGGVDITPPPYTVSVPVEKDMQKLISLCDVVVDFSLKTSTMKHYKICEKNGKGLITGTTGLTNREVASLKRASKKIPIVYSPNMSLGINILRRLAKIAAKMLPATYDIEIVETHHRYKQDAPSGTAVALGNDIAAVRKINISQAAKMGRSGISPRQKNEIAFHALRGGTVTGTHEIHFIGDNDQLVLTHSAFNREIFTGGIMQAIRFIKNKKKGWFSMDDVLG